MDSGPDAAPKATIQVIWERLVAANGPAAIQPVPFDGTYFATCGAHFYRYDTQAQVVSKTLLPLDTMVGLGQGAFVAGGSGYGAVYRAPNAANHYFVTLTLDGQVDPQAGIDIGPVGRVGLAWSAALGQYLLYAPVYPVPSGSAPPYLVQYRFDAAGKKLAGPTTVEQPAAGGGPMVDHSLWVGDQLVLLGPGGQSTPGVEGATLYLRVLDPPYKSVQAFDLLPPGHVIQELGNAALAFATDGKQVFVGYPGKGTVGGGTRVTLAKTDGTVSPTAPLVSTDPKYQANIPHSATFYKGHFVMVGKDPDVGAYVTVYDQKLEQVFSPTDLPLAPGPGPPAEMEGARIFTVGTDLVLVYARYDIDLRMLRFRIKGL